MTVWNNSTMSSGSLESLLPLPEAREAALYARFTTLGIDWMTSRPRSRLHRRRGVYPSWGASRNPYEEPVPRRQKRCAVAGGRSGRIVHRLEPAGQSAGDPALFLWPAGAPGGDPGHCAGRGPPLALMNDRACRVTAIFDEAMLAADPINFHPLRNDRTTAIAATDLIRFARACAHDPLIMTLPEKP